MIRIAAIAIAVTLAGCAAPHPEHAGASIPSCATAFNACCWLPDGTNSGYCSEGRW